MKNFRVFTKLFAAILFFYSTERDGNRCKYGGNIWEGE